MRGLKVERRSMDSVCHPVLIGMGRVKYILIQIVNVVLYTPENPSRRETDMEIFKSAKENFESELQNFARARIIRRLEEADLNYRALDPKEFDELVQAEKELLESDAKKVGLGIGVGFALSMLVGF
jgi:hypothetical protein